jgi:hypothetical protein
MFKELNIAPMSEYKGPVSREIVIIKEMKILDRKVE